MRESFGWIADELVETTVNNAFPDPTFDRVKSPIEQVGVRSLSFIPLIKGNTLEFELGKPAREGHRYLRVSGLQHIYTISDFEVGQLRQDIDSLYDSE